MADYLLDHIARHEKPEPPMGIVHLHWHGRNFQHIPYPPGTRREGDQQVTCRGYWKVVSKRNSLCLTSPLRCRIVKIESATQ